MPQNQNNGRLHPNPFANFVNEPNPNRNPIFKLLWDDLYQSHILVDENGHFVTLPFPTGVGKTYNILDFVSEVMIDEEVRESMAEGSYQPRIFYYITNSVDNVKEAYDSLEKLIRGKSRLSEEQKAHLLARMLLLPRNSTSLIEAVTSHPKEFSRVKRLFSIDRSPSLANEINRLAADYKALLSLNLEPQHKRSMKERLEREADRCYRKILYHIRSIQLGENPVDLSSRDIEAMKPLIPGVSFEYGQARVLFMTTKKFLFGFQQSIGKFHPARNLANDILIIDEIDRQNHEILHHLCSANDNDLLATIRTIHSNLKEQVICTKQLYEGIPEIFEDYLDDVKSFIRKYRLEYSFDIHESLANEAAPILFSDRLTTHCTNLKKNLKLSFNSNTAQHEIAEEDQFKGIREEHDFPAFLNALESLVNRAFFSVLQNAENRYRRNSIPEGAHYEIVSLTSAQIVASILDQLNLHSLRSHLNQQLNYLVGRQRSSRHIPASYHSWGIKMIEIGRLPEAHDSVMFRNHGFDTSPTGMIRAWVGSGCHIIGISATAQCASVVHNFDINYLRESLGHQFIALTQSQIKSIHDYYSRERDYEGAGVKIVVESNLQNAAFLRELVTRWKPGVRNYHLSLCHLFETEVEDMSFNISWLSKLCEAIRTFTQNPCSRYMVAMLNRFVKPNTADFLTWYVKSLGCNERSIDIRLVPAVSSDFLRQGGYKKDVIDFLEKQHGKVVVLTTYQTMSSGKNPDYKFNPKFENNTLKHVGRRSRDRTDIDCMYLEEPTNLLSVEGSPESKTSDRLMLLGHGMALQEAGYLSPNKASVWTRDVISHEKPSDLCSKLKNIYYRKESRDCLHAIYRVIEQAVGRSARTEMKRDEILLMIDSGLVGLLAKDNRQSSLFSHEYKELVKFAKSKIRELGIESDEYTSVLLNKARLNTKRSLSYIDKLLKSIDRGATPGTINSWNELRENLLKCPASIVAPRDRFYYVESPHSGGYEFHATKEYSASTYDFFNSNHRGSKNITESESRLPILMACDVVRSHFATRDFCTKWPDDSKYYLTPPMFKNIYLGALGEEAGIAILRSKGFNFEPLAESDFEKFDSIIEIGGCRSLIDFKHWNLRSWRNLPNDVQLNVMNDIAAKLNTMSIRRLVVCNTIANKGERVLFFDSNFNEVENWYEATIVSIPCLIDAETSAINFQIIRELANWMLY